MKKTLIGLSLVLAAAAAQAADPVATAITPGYSFAEYLGDAKVGSGRVDLDQKLLFIDEATVGGLKSWYVFFDPSADSAVQATLRFDAPIVGILRTRNELSQSNATWRVDVDGDGKLNDYANVAGTGLEKADGVSFTAGQRTLSLIWTTNWTGDHLRVLTAVPEPSTYALLAAGLFAIGLRLRRLRSVPSR